MVFWEESYMDENTMRFAQLLAEWMDREGVTCTFAAEPRPDRRLWDQILQREGARDRETLEEIAACLRRDATDFECVEEIMALLAGRGLSTSPRHDFG